MTSSDIPHELPITKVTLLPPAAAADMSLSEKSTLESCFPSMHMAIRYPRHSLSIAFPSVSSAFCISLGEALSESFDSFNSLTLILQYLLSLFMYSPQASFRYCSFKFSHRYYFYIYHQNTTASPSVSTGATFNM